MSRMRGRKNRKRRVLFTGSKRGVRLGGGVKGGSLGLKTRLGPHVKVDGATMKEEGHKTRLVK